MHKIVLDSNIYDKIENDNETKLKISNFVNNKILCILVPTTVMRELEKAPFKGVPNWFHTKNIGDSVFIADYSHTDKDRVGDGKILKQHQGKSKKRKDAIIVDAANNDADIFVSEDCRCRKRLKEISQKIQTLDYSEFITWLNTIK